MTYFSRGTGRYSGRTDIGASQFISTRSKKLVEHGLAVHLGNGVYQITERGEQYLDGEIDTSEDMPDEVPEAAESSEGGNAEETGEESYVETE